jgi:MFS family permease
MYGHKKIYSFGLIGFSLFGALSAGIHSSFIALCVFRALQGASAACTVPTAYAIIGITYEGKARELAVAGLGVSATSGAIIGSIGTSESIL